MSQSDLTRELIPLSANLRQVATVGLQALDLLRQHESAPAGWQSQQSAFLKIAQQPQAVLVNMIAPAVEKLVQAVRPQSQ
jgi:hexosaminidase